MHDVSKLPMQNITIGYSKPFLCIGQFCVGKYIYFKNILVDCCSK